MKGLRVDDQPAMWKPASWYVDRITSALGIDELEVNQLLIG